MRQLLPFLIACGTPEPDEHAFGVAPPPGIGGITLIGPSSHIAGTDVHLLVTAPDLVVGDRVDFGYGSILGTGPCPFRALTGGTLCLDVAGRVRQLGTVYAEDVGGTVQAEMTAQLNDRFDAVYAQAYRLRGAASATSNVVEIELEQPYPVLDPRVDDVEGAVADHETRLDDHDDDLAAAQAAFGNINADVTTLEGRVDGHDGSIGGLSGDVTTLAGRVDGHDGSISSLNGSVTTLDGRLDGHDGSISSLNGSVTTLDGRLDGHGSISLLSGDVMTLDGRLDGHDGSISSLNGDVMTLDGRLDGHDGSISSLNGDVMTLDGRLDGHDGSISSLNGDVMTLDGRVDGHDVSIGGLSADATTLDGRVDGHDVAIGAAQSSIGLLQTDVGGLISATSTLATQASNLETTTSGLSTQVTSLNSSVSTLNTTVASHTSTLSTHGSTLSTHGSTLSGHTTSIDDHEARLDVLEAQPRTYYYVGAFATPAEWEADLIQNGQLGRFCQAMGKTYVGGTNINGHYKTAQKNGYFYAGWYYVGPRYCPDDTPYAGNTHEVTNPYSVWIYSGNCGCCVETSEWTLERSAFITCR